MSNPMQDLHTLGLNPFAVTLLAESMLKSAYVQQCGIKPLTFEFPVRRGDCEGWAGVRITIEAVPAAPGVEGRPELPDPECLKREPVCRFCGFESPDCTCGVGGSHFPPAEKMANDGAHGVKASDSGVSCTDTPPFSREGGKGGE